MAVFGMPGGAEWLVIIAVAAILLVLVPGVVVFGMGYFTGKRAAELGVEPKRKEESAPPGEDVSSEERERINVDVDEPEERKDEDAHE